MDIFWTVVVIALVMIGVAWGWVHYNKSTTDVLDKTGKAVDDAVNQAEDIFQKRTANTTANTANTTDTPSITDGYRK